MAPEVIQEIIDDGLAVDEQELSEKLTPLYQFIKWMTKPTIIGRENLPDKPVLFVANHATLAVDGFFVGPVLLHEFGRCARAMADEFLYVNPTIRKFVVAAGGIMGDQKIGDAFMEAGKDLLLFPGGAHEANKRVEERYTLQWKKRTGFIRLAARHGYTIVPLGLVGPDEWYGRYIERDDLANSMLGKLLMRAGVSDELLHSDLAPPIPKGVLGTLLPKPERSYMGLGEPIDLSKYKGQELSESVQLRLRKKVSDSLEGVLAELLLIQSQQKPNDGLLRKLLTL